MATTASDIQALYVAYFNRPADPSGLAFWLARANANGGVNFVANEFSNSKEYIDTYAGKSNLAIVDQIYLNLFGRHAEAEGLLHWAQKLDSGELKFGNVALTIFNNAQNDDKIAIASKLAAAGAFTDSLTTGDEILGYDGTAANAILKAWLTGINTDAQLKAAITAANLDAVASSASAAKDASTATQAVLTTGVDTLTGTAGNDVFNATGKTFTALDTIDGSTGTNTVNLVDADATQGNGLPALVTLKNIQKMNVITTGTVGNVAGSAVTALKETKTFTFGVPSSATLKLHVDLGGTTTPTDTAVLGATADTAAAAFADAINTAYGSVIAVAAAGVVTITAPTAGTPLPAVTVTGAIGSAPAAGDFPTVATTQGNVVGSAASSAIVYDVSAVAAMTNFSANANGNVNVKVNAATASVITTTGGAVTVAGGVTVKSTGATGAESFTGAALKSVDATGGTTVTANDLSSGVSTGTLTSVALTSNNGVATLTGDALTTLSLTKSKGTVNLVNGTLKHTLTLNTNDVGNDTGPAYLQVNDTNAATINLTNTGAKATTTSFLDLNAAAATKLAVTNSAVLNLDAAGLTNLASLTVAGAGSFKTDVQGLAALVSVDASASTGKNDITVNGVTDKLVVKGGAGADTITVVGALDADAVITLGAGDDTYKFTVAAADGASVSGGDGKDTLAVVDGALIDAAAAKVYTGFEILDVTTGTGVYDMSILGLTDVVAHADTGALTISQAAAATTISLSNTGSADGIAAGADATYAGITYALKTATGTADSVTVNLTANDGVSDGVATGKVTLGAFNSTTALETLKFSSNVGAVDTDDTATDANEATAAKDYTNVVTDVVGATIKSLVLSGAASIEITDLHTAALTRIDASAATGDVTITNAVTGALGSVTYLGGSGVDTYTASGKGDLISGNAGADVFTLAAGKDTVVYSKATDSVLSLVDSDDDGATDMLGGFDTINLFTSATDKIDLSQLGLATGAARGAITVLSTVTALDHDHVKTAIGTGVDLFNDGVADRSLAILTDGTDSFLLVDTSKDGNFTFGTDLAIKLTGVTALVVTDISFG